MASQQQEQQQEMSRDEFIHQLIDHFKQTQVKTSTSDLFASYDPVQYAYDQLQHDFPNVELHEISALHVRIRTGLATVQYNDHGQRIVDPEKDRTIALEHNLVLTRQLLHGILTNCANLKQNSEQQQLYAALAADCLVVFTRYMLQLDRAQLSKALRHYSKPALTLDVPAQGSIQTPASRITNQAIPDEYTYAEEMDSDEFVYEGQDPGESYVHQEALTRSSTPALEEMRLLEWSDLQERLVYLLSNLSYSILSGLTMKQWKEHGLTRSIDAICRSLLYMQQNNPTGKSVLHTQTNEYSEALHTEWTRFLYLFRDRLMHQPEQTSLLEPVVRLLRDNVISNEERDNMPTDVDSPEDIVVSVLGELATSNSFEKNSTARRHLLGQCEEVLPSILVPKVEYYASLLGKGGAQDTCLDVVHLARRLGNYVTLLQFYIQPSRRSPASVTAIRGVAEFGLVRCLVSLLTQNITDATPVSYARMLRPVVRFLVTCAFYAEAEAKFMARVKPLRELVLSEEIFCHAFPADSVLLAIAFSIASDDAFGDIALRRLESLCSEISSPLFLVDASMQAMQALFVVETLIQLLPRLPKWPQVGRFQVVLQRSFEKLPELVASRQSDRKEKEKDKNDGSRDELLLHRLRNAFKRLLRQDIGAKAD